jgi:hypothetical protein
VTFDVFLHGVFTLDQKADRVDELPFNEALLAFGGVARLDLSDR